MNAGRVMLLLVAVSLLVNAGCSCCSERAVPIVPMGLYGDTNNSFFNVTNVTVYDYSWWTSGSWLVNNVTTAPSGVNVTGAFGATNVSTDLICIGGTCISNWSEAGNSTAGNPGGNNQSVQFNYNNAFLGVDSFRYLLNDNLLYLSNNGTHGQLLTINGTLGQTQFTGNDIRMSRIGPNYITAMDPTGSLYLGAGGTSGALSIRYDAAVNTVYLYDLGVLVKGWLHSTVNVSAPLLNASCINLAGTQVCNWTAVNGSMGAGSEVFNGTFNETEGAYVYNSTPYRVDFNETLLNTTIDSRGDNYLLTDGTRTLNGNLNITGNVTNPANSSWGYYNNGSCIVIGNLYYVSEC